MPERDESVVSVDGNDRSHKLTNEDFRKLMMTPRAASHSSSSSTTVHHSTRGGSGGLGSGGPAADLPAPLKDPDANLDLSAVSKAELRRKKKNFYAKLKKQEEDKMVELSQRYRDRARERRDGQNPDYQNEDPLSTAGGYRAVAPDLKSGLDAAERRRQMIQESKFLGGDMEHTHLVKGLDFALLEKVRSEITTKEKEMEDEMEKSFKVKKPEVVEKNIEFKTPMARNIHRLLFKESDEIERNELFQPGRMAYVIDLDDEFAESDIPTTLLRSKADVPQVENQATLTTNDIVINKLSQILSYLRQGGGGQLGKAGKKLKRKDKAKFDDRGNLADDTIYADIGSYNTNMSANTKSRPNAEKPARGSYFEKPADDMRVESNRQRQAMLEDTIRQLAADRKMKGGAEADGDRHRGDRDRERDGRKQRKNREIGDLGDKEERTLGSILNKEETRSMSKSQKLLARLVAEPEGYAECYPGFDEMHDAIDDSDDDADYSKMDMGNKKGPIGRWDFDTAEEYSDYMSHREAMPKAAFQYGVKMSDGRSTRKSKVKNEKAELDRDWQKIQNIIHKRKGEQASLGDEGPDSKSSRR